MHLRRVSMDQVFPRTRLLRVLTEPDTGAVSGPARAILAERIRQRSRDGTRLARSVSAHMRNTWDRMRDSM
jgi:hypothetical protein